jgi:hypothetical protein
MEILIIVLTFIGIILQIPIGYVLAKETKKLELNTFLLCIIIMFMDIFFISGIITFYFIFYIYFQYIKTDKVEI